MLDAHLVRTDGTLHQDKENSMSKADIVRAWKDPRYRQGLSNAELAALPENPAGKIELSDEELDGSDMLVATTYATCTCTTATQQITCPFLV
jgi:mersacidin/lichenicidin family type 2 lantibiotic